MKIHLLSDLHHEFFRRPADRRLIPGYSRWKCGIPDTEADVIVLAGDIDGGTKGVEWAISEAERLKKPIIYVPGNHEYYGFDLIHTLERMRELSHNTGVTVLNNQMVEIDDIRFLGSTLWTDYSVDPKTSQSDAMSKVGLAINDHRLIKCRDNRLTTVDALTLHNESRKWLEEMLAVPYSGKTVVITHHGPSPACQHPDYGLSAISTSFYSDLDRLVEMADLWVYGHTHANMRTTVFGTPLISNQFGYSQVEYCHNFDPELTVDL